MAYAGEAGAVLRPVHGLCHDRMDSERHDDFGRRTGGAVSVYDEPFAGGCAERLIVRDVC